MKCIFVMISFTNKTILVSRFAFLDHGTTNIARLYENRSAQGVVSRCCTFRVSSESGFFLPMGRIGHFNRKELILPRYFGTV
jgi:hypothetical protein